MAWNRCKGNAVHKYPYKGFIMASKAEVTFATYMDEEGIVWLYEPDQFEWSPPVKIKKYKPDFKIMCKDGSYFYVEYKGYLRPEDKVKMKAMKLQHPKLDIRFVFQRANKPIYKGSKTTYAMWAEKLGYLWSEGRMPKEWLEGASYVELQ